MLELLGSSACTSLFLLVFPLREGYSLGRMSNSTGAPKEKTNTLSDVGLTKQFRMFRQFFNTSIRLLETAPLWLTRTT